MSRSQKASRIFTGDDREMLVSMLRNAAKAVKNGLVQDAVALGIVAGHMEAFVQGFEQSRFREAQAGEWSDIAISECLQRGPYSTRWDGIADEEPQITRHEYTEFAEIEAESREVA
jgi:hypothetical protein